MKPNSSAFPPARTLLAALLLWLSIASSARAGLTLSLTLIHNCQAGVYTCDPELTATTNGGDSTPITYDQVNSPNTNFAGGLGNAFYLRNTYVNFTDFMQELTNGTWTLVLNQGDPSQHVYTFHVSTTGIVSNSLGQVTINFPLEGAAGLTNQPNFEWQGPANWDSIKLGIHNSALTVFEFTNVPPTFTNAVMQPACGGPNNFGPEYDRDVTASVAVTTPMDSSHSSPPGWAYTASLDSFNGVDFSVGSGAPAPAALVAHYTFDDPNNLLHDSSGNGNDLIGGNSYGGPTPQYVTNGVSGGAVQFNGANWFDTSLISSIAGDFSISLWLNTTQYEGFDTFDAFAGAGILWADVPGVANDAVPMALNGSQLGFFTGNPDLTLRSSASINSGSFVHIVVTRAQATGVRKIYINGQLDSTDYGSVTSLTDPQELYFGMNVDYQQGIVGTVDDAQFYTGVLTDSQVLAIYRQPGITSPEIGNGEVAHYAFDDADNLGVDSSGNGNNITIINGNPVYDSNGVADGAVDLDGASWFVLPTNVLNAIAGTYSVSLWISTVDSFGSDFDQGYDGEGILSADVSGVHNDSIPMALNGDILGFFTGNPDDTLHSSSPINTGNFTHIVVTRDQTNGVKQVYINGVLESTDTASAALLNDSTELDLGMDVVTGIGIAGTIDDVQIYNRVISSNEVAQLFNVPGAPLAAPPVPPFVNVVHYTFDNSNDLGHDDSGNGNNATLITFYIGPPLYTPNGVSGGAAMLNGGNWFIVPTNAVPALYGDFTVSLWLNTAQSFGSDTDQGFQGAGIVWADTPGVKNDAIPMALNGTKLGFFTGNPESTLHSTNDINTGAFVHLAVTRTQSTGQRKIYINGVPDSTDTASTLSLTDITNIFLGMSYNNNQGIIGTIDDFQLYTGALPDYQIAYLFSHPGSVAIPTTASTVTLLNPQASGGNLAFSFVSINGSTHTIETSTNLTSGLWQTNSVVAGDGTLKNVSVPENGARQLFIRVQTN